MIDPNNFLCLPPRGFNEATSKFNSSLHNRRKSGDRRHLTTIDETKNLIFKTGPIWHSRCASDALRFAATHEVWIGCIIRVYEIKIDWLNQSAKKFRSNSVWYALNTDNYSHQCYGDQLITESAKDKILLNGLSIFISWPWRHQLHHP